MVPSLPGYGFSSAPSRPGFGAAEIASTLNSLMLALGYDHYTAQGASTHLLLTVVFFQASWQVAACFVRWWHAYSPQSLKSIEREKLSCLALVLGRCLTRGGGSFHVVPMLSASSHVLSSLTSLSDTIQAAVDFTAKCAD